MCTWKPCTPSALKHGSASEPTTPLYPLNLSPHSSPRSKVASSAAKEDSMCKPAHLYAYFCDIAQNLDLLHKDLQSTTMLWKVQCAPALSYKMLHLITLLRTECFIKYSYTLQGTTCLILLLRLPLRSISTTSRYDVSKLCTVDKAQYPHFKVPLHPAISKEPFKACTNGSGTVRLNGKVQVSPILEKF